VPYVSGKAGSSLGAFIQLIEGIRFETQNLPLPEMVEILLDKSQLLHHYQSAKDGAARIENLQQLISAARLFISAEGLGMDAPALLVLQATASEAPELVMGHG